MACGVLGFRVPGSPAVAGCCKTFRVPSWARRASEACPLYEFLMCPEAWLCQSQTHYTDLRDLEARGPTQLSEGVRRRVGYTPWPQRTTTADPPV